MRSFFFIAASVAFCAINANSASLKSAKPKPFENACFPNSLKNTDHINVNAYSANSDVDYFPEDGECAYGYSMNGIKYIFDYAKWELNKLIINAKEYNFEIIPENISSTTVEVLDGCLYKIGPKGKTTYVETFNTLKKCGFKGIDLRFSKDKKDLTAFFAYHLEKIAGPGQNIIDKDVHYSFIKSVDHVSEVFKNVSTELENISNGMNKNKRKYYFSNDFIIKSIEEIISFVEQLSKLELKYDRKQ
ncbi:hypothetical protein AYI69_g9338 [Smittium culicis]|uniref:Uncharacterized protein n=1 Tax=Smittium culicis TaxID=133412 RepID=A0A1R1XDD9_9FUNG|nr:hypothetical protein AYI69_g9338 [Smittium culicis]